MIVFGGFLGAGKTTMMMRVAQMIEASGKRVGVIMNDQGDQLVVDTGFGRARGFDVAEVTGGCFCCRFDALVSTTAGLVDDLRADVVLAEAVGSCADLNATVIRPLKEYYGERFEVAPLVVMVDPSRLKDLTGEPVFEGNGVSAPEDLVPYLFRKQIEEAHVIVLNKADLLPEGEAEGLVGLLQSTFPHARTIAASAETGAGVDALLELLSMLSEGAHRKLEIDYRLYADAEAELAWLNTTLKVRGNGQQFRPAEYVDLFLSKLSAECERRGYVVGHAKVQLTTPDGWTKASLVRAGDEPVIASRQRTDADGGELLVNARVEADPTALEGLVRVLVASNDEIMGTVSEPVHTQSFRPAPPQPTHRLA
jgi:G3E family GTPase